MSNWSLSWRGVLTVTELEITQRVRSRRWIWALIGWFVLIGALTTLVIWAASMTAQPNLDGASIGLQAGPFAFGLIVYLVLGLALMIAPAFTATSINADRTAGVLATLQATRLSALEIVAGKLLAAWLTALLFFVVALPFLGWAMALGNISVWQVVVTLAVMFAEVAVVCAIGLGFSAMISRAAGAVMLTYLAVVVLSVVTVIVVGLSTLLLTGPSPVRVWGLSAAATQAYQDQVDASYIDHPNAPPPAPPVDKCVWYDRTDTATRLDQIWWVLIANPFVVVADAAPLPPSAEANLSGYVGRSADPLAAVRWGIRQMGQPPAREIDECTSLFSGLPGFTVNQDAAGNVTVTTGSGTLVATSPVKVPVVNAETPVWPWGLGVHLLIGAGFGWLAVRRLRLPYGRLPGGNRVA